MCRILTSTLLVLVAIPCLAQPNVRHDGNWWRTLTSDMRIMYAGGFVDGMELGNVYSYESPLTTQNQGAFLQATQSYEKNTKRYFGNATVGQVIDGLNTFFDDYRNRSIHMVNAINAVLRSIAGEDIEDFVIESRRKATR